MWHIKKFLLKIFLPNRSKSLIACSRLSVVAMAEIKVTALSASPNVRDMRSEILMEVVANGDRVGFIHPLEREAANAFWGQALASAVQDRRIVQGAWDGDVLTGTVSLLLDCPPNQPHRAEIAKLMTRLNHRAQGIATTLMRTAEKMAVERSRTLLVLDTAADGGASGLYEKLGFVGAGEVPDYALKPHGSLTATIIYWKRIGGQFS
jgi:ribosomal protein S18 acetylase RimI-like enzyme